MFTSLSDRLAATFKTLRGKGKLSESDVNKTVRDIRMAPQWQEPWSVPMGVWSWRVKWVSEVARIVSHAVPMDGRSARSTFTLRD